MKKDLCIQCHKPIQAQTTDGFNVCSRAGCPNYGLLQLSEKALIKFENEYKKRK